jgi:hypothetical protein
MFVQEQNEFSSYTNIMRACFHMLDENISDQFKVSNVPTLIGWNTSMTIDRNCDVLPLSLDDLLN